MFERKTKLTKFYYKNGQRKEDQEKLEAKDAYFIEQILKDKNDYVLRMNKLNDTKTAPKTYWSILKPFFYIAKRFQSVFLYLSMGNCFRFLYKS